MLHIAPTERYTVLERGASVVPRLPLEDAPSEQALQLLKRHGYFVADVHVGIVKRVFW